MGSERRWETWNREEERNMGCVTERYVINEGGETMHRLSSKEKELVAIGASIGSNCVSCVVYHILKAKKSDLSDPQIREAILIADSVKKVPAEDVRKTALALLVPGDPTASKGETPCDCQQTGDDKQKGGSKCC